MYINPILGHTFYFIAFNIKNKLSTIFFVMEKRIIKKREKSERCNVKY